MRVTAVLNQKGGVGKTVTVINLAHILATEHKKRVLVIDADSQANSTEFFGGDSNLGNLTNVLIHNGAAYFNAQTTDWPGLEILPASDSLMDLDLTKIQTGSVSAAALKNALGDLQERYDIALIDCPPAFTASCAAALIAATDVLIPIKLDAFSVRGMTNLYHQVKNMRKLNPQLKVCGCLETMWTGNETDLWADKILRDSLLPVFMQRIRATGKVGSMTFERKPLREHSPRSAAAVDYRKFTTEYLWGGVKNG